MKERLIAVLLLMGIGLLFLSGLNAVPLTDPDEVFYVETAKSMIETENFLTPVMFGHPQFEKPPLFYWMLMWSFHHFGVVPAAARLVPALVGVFGVLATFWFASNRGSACRGEYVPGSCTHRPSIVTGKLRAPKVGGSDLFLGP